MSEEGEKLTKKDLKRFEKRLSSDKKDVVMNTLEEIHQKIDKRVTKLLTMLLENQHNPDNWDVRQKCLEILGEIGNKNAVPHMVPYLHDANPLVRETCAYALGQIGDKQAVMYLIAILRDPEYTVRENVAGALARIGDARAIDALVGNATCDDPEIRLSVMPALTAFPENEKIIDALVKGMEDDVSQVRFPAIIAFNKIKSPKAIEPLIDNLKSEDPLLEKVASDALVYNLGWGAIDRDGKLTKFGEKRRKLLKEQLEKRSLEGATESIVVEAGEQIYLRDVEDALVKLLELEDDKEKKLRDYLKQVSETYELSRI
ncbi:MAG: HEAT repeat domain-containing protein [Promethearchaeota archaeon]